MRLWSGGGFPGNESAVQTQSHLAQCIMVWISFKYTLLAFTSLQFGPQFDDIRGCTELLRGGTHGEILRSVEALPSESSVKPQRLWNPSHFLSSWTRSLPALHTPTTGITLAMKPSPELSIDQYCALHLQNGELNKLLYEARLPQVFRCSSKTAHSKK